MNIGATPTVSLFTRGWNHFYYRHRFTASRARPARWLIIFFIDEFQFETRATSLGVKFREIGGAGAVIDRYPAFFSLAAANCAV